MLTYIYIYIYIYTLVHKLPTVCNQPTNQLTNPPLINPYIYPKHARKSIVSDQKTQGGVDWLVGSPFLFVPQRFCSAFGLWLVGHALSCPVLSCRGMWTAAGSTCSSRGLLVRASVPT